VGTTKSGRRLLRWGRVALTDRQLGKPPLRQAYEAVERIVEPPLSALARNPDTVNALALVSKASKFVGATVDGVTGGAWHLANLPTRRDVQRLRTQLGQLDREVRRLTVQLELERERNRNVDERD
jgi:hypothetical protein